MKINVLPLIVVALMHWLFSSTSYADVQKDNISPFPSCNEKKMRLSDSHYVEIGGIKQWITINGSNCSNPILLIVHGGPGNPLSLYHASLFQNWEDEFTVVHWDQRGSGKTYEANQDAGELTLEQLTNTALSTDLLVSDGLGVTDYIRKNLGQDKIIISGTSWGAALAVKMVFSGSSKYHFYVGVSQLVNDRRNNQESYSLVKSLAVEKKDQAALDVLDSIGAPPWSNPRSFGKLRRIIRAYEEEVVSKFPELEIGKEYISEKTRAAYFAGEEFSFVKYVGLSGDGMAQNIALDECCTELKIPIYLIQGENDLLTTPNVTEAFFDKIEAPSKEYIQVKGSAHDPNIKMLNKQLDILKIGVKKWVKQP